MFSLFSLFSLSSHCVLFKFEHGTNTQGAAKWEDWVKDELAQELGELWAMGCGRGPNHVMRHANIVKTLVAPTPSHFTAASATSLDFIFAQICIFNSHSLSRCPLGKEENKKQEGRACVYLNLFS